MAAGAVLFFFVVVSLGCDFDAADESLRQAVVHRGQRGQVLEQVVENCFYACIFRFQMVFLFLYLN